MTALTVQQLSASVPGLSLASATKWQPSINRALTLGNIKSGYDCAAFLAQTGHESGSFRYLVESLDYDPAALMRTFLAFRRQPALAEQYGRTDKHPANQRMIGVIAYGGREGNRPNTDDGWNYRGRGLIQLTFLNNYVAASHFFRLPLALQPELLEQQDNAAATASYYWHARKMWGLPFAEITRRINPAMHAHDKRVARFNQACKVLGIDPNKPVSSV